MGRLLAGLGTALALLPVSAGGRAVCGLKKPLGKGGFGVHKGLRFLGGLGGSRSDGGVFLTAAVIIIVVAIIFYNITKARAPRKITYHQPIVNKNAEIEKRIKEHDPGFSLERFLSWAGQVFVKLQQAWTERDWKKARPFESDSLFSLHKSQLDEYIKNGTVNVMENVRVNGSFLCDYAADDKYEFVTVFMNTRYNDYIIKEDTKEVVGGNPEKTYNIQYMLKFMRMIGVKTGEFSNMSTTRCPNCGAPVDVDAAGRCAFCGAVITTGEHDWVLCNMDDVAP